MNRSQLIDVDISKTVYSDSNNNTISMNQMSPRLSLAFLIIDMIILVPICYFHYMIKCMVRREKEKKGHTIIKNILACYSVIVPVVFILCFTYVDVVLRYAYPPFQIFGNWFCHGYGIFAHSGGMYIGAFSFFAAVVKYWFIVHNVAAKQFGEIKARNIFMVLYLTIPIFMAILNSISTGNLDQNMWVNLCWGLKNRNLVDDISYESVSDHLGSYFLCNDRRYEITKHVGIQASHYIIPILRFICVITKILYLAFFSNLGELLLYILIFRYLNR